MRKLRQQTNFTKSIKQSLTLTMNPRRVKQFDKMYLGNLIRLQMFVNCYKLYIADPNVPLKSILKKPVDQTQDQACMETTQRYAKKRVVFRPNVEQHFLSAFGSGPILEAIDIDNESLEELNVSLEEFTEIKSNTVGFKSDLAVSARSPVVRAVHKADEAKVTPISLPSRPTFLESMKNLGPARRVLVQVNTLETAIPENTQAKVHPISTGPRRVLVANTKVAEKKKQVKHRAPTGARPTGARLTSARPTGAKPTGARSTAVHKRHLEEKKTHTNNKAKRFCF